jgi:hypothetical protein
MFLRKTALGFILLTAVFATAPVLTEPPAQTPISKDNILELHLGGASVEVLLAYVKAAASVTPLSPDDVLALKKKGVPDPVIAAYLDRQAEGSSPSSVPSPPKPAPTRRLRITGQLERVPNLSRRWDKYTKELKLRLYKDPLAQGVALLFTSRVSDAGSNNLPVGPQQPVCWCARGNGCTSLRVLSVQNGCGRLETPGDGKWDRHLSSSEWRTLRYGDTFVALNLDMPPTAKVVELSILANRCSDTGSYMFPITSTRTDMSPGSPVPFYLVFSPHGSKDFSASIELRVLTEGEGAFDVELRNVKMDDRDSESRASTEKCIREHGSAQCHYVSLDEDLDGLQAGVAMLDSTRCR